MSDSALEKPVFCFKPHSPNMKNWAYFSDASGIMGHEVMLGNHFAMWINLFEKFVMLNNEMLQTYCHVMTGENMMFIICSRSSKSLQ